MPVFTEEVQPYVKRAAQAAHIIQVLENDGGYDDVRKAATGFEDRIEQVRIIRSLSSIGRAAFVDYGADGVALFCGGVVTRTATTMLNGYGNTFSMDNLLGFNIASAEDAFGPLAAAYVQLRPVTKRLLAYGHSGGGVVAEAFVKYMATRRLAEPAEVQTLGAPKPGNKGCCIGGFDIHRYRWVNVGDAVPGIPVASFGSHLGITLLLFKVAYAPEKIEHPGGAWMLTATTVNQSSTDAGTFPDMGSTGVALWLSGSDAISGSPHGISTYERNLTNLYDRLKSSAESYNLQNVTSFPRPRIIVNPRWPVPPELIVNPQLATIAGNVVRTQSGVSIPATIEWSEQMPQSKIDPTLKVRTAKIGASYAVIWRDIVILYCDFPSSAKTIASSMNRMLRNLGKSSTISSDQFALFVTTYLSIASTAGMGVRPPLTVT